MQTNLSTSGESESFINRRTSARLSGWDWTNIWTVRSSGAYSVIQPGKK